LDDRLAALAALADGIEANRDELQLEIVRTTKKPRRVAGAEVDLAIRRLRAFDEVVPLLYDRAPAGTVAVMFPANAALSNPVATIGAAFLAGNRVRARFPSALRQWVNRIEPLICGHLVGVTFDQGTGQRFLQNMASDPDVTVAMVFGDDSWASGYEELMRSTRTKFIFEGPGKDPFLVLEDADVESAARDAVRGGYYNAGQACTSPERVYVHAEVYERFLDRVVELTSEQVVGDPESPDTVVGPIVSQRVAQRIAAQLQEALVNGARIRSGGGIEVKYLRDGTRTTHVHPTVVTDVKPNMSIMRDETFGPILPVQQVKSTEEALHLAAASRYGLSATIYGGGPAEVDKLARSHGQVFHNEIWLNHAHRNLHAPYGGRKHSGWVWTWEDGSFVRREGPRTNALEFSKPAR
jgi:succinate-semialdehyde dehydrogenase/glutarate-semialdehyde dehydrogenase